jgi:5,5'-dehydrodivanillate O-demethylase
MLSADENKLFTSVGPGTPMGELLRRYWQPVGCTELITSKPTRTKVLGEELMLYRGANGKPVLMQLRCAHRSLALDYGRVEGNSIRCPYHGWLYDETGQCTAQPAEPEDSGFKDKVKLKTYPTQEVSGLIFGYMGPAPAPVLPLYDVMRMENGAKGVQMRNVNANWLNAVENIVDVSHLAWLHGYTFPAYGAKKVEYHWDRKPYGADNVMTVDGIADSHISCYVYPNVNRFTAPPADGSNETIHSMIFRVPTDDANVMQYFLRFYPADQKTFRTWHSHVKLGEYKALESDWWGIDVTDQDRMAVEQQGVIADREHEHLGVSDGGIILLRKMLRESLALIEEGKDPLCIIRDPAQQNVNFGQRAAGMQQRQAGANYDAGITRPSEDAVAAE